MPTKKNAPDRDERRGAEDVQQGTEDTSCDFIQCSRCGQGLDDIAVRGLCSRCFFSADEPESAGADGFAHLERLFGQPRGGRH